MEFKEIFLNVTLIDHTTVVLESDVHIIQKVMYWVLVVVNIKIRTNNDFLYSNLSKPLIKL